MTLCRKRHKCVGTLITQQHVLTLANCFYALDPVRIKNLVSRALLLYEAVKEMVKVSQYPIVAILHVTESDYSPIN